MKTKDAVAVVTRALRKSGKPNLAQVIEEALNPKPPKTPLELLRDYEELMDNRPSPPFFENRAAWAAHGGRMRAWRGEVREIIQKADAKTGARKR